LAVNRLVVVVGSTIHGALRLLLNEEVTTNQVIQAEIVSTEDAIV